jgi:serine/threonine protein kinase/Tfp pilus assembly protein PilF
VDELSASGLSLKDLSASEFSRLSTLFDESIDMTPAERDAWLAALESGEPRLGAVLREIFALQSGDEGRRFLDTHDLAARHSVSLIESDSGLIGKLFGSNRMSALLGDGNSGQEKTASGPVPGERVGPYELVRLLGAGGMAEVWLAKRVDGAFKREVALKLPMVSRLRKDLEERFIRERDILASLEHPNIARLYDGGLDAQGLPYLAMEYVPGEALTTWCDAKRLGVASRLTLLHQVLGAVQYAHDRRVIHRDLKPSNILVSEAGAVRLLDFGVAKLLEETEGSQLTRLYGRPLTPDYASPEQLKGDALDGRSDVYSVGVLLYELLTGKRPYGLNAGASLGSLEQALATVEVRKPSTKLDERAGANRDTTQEKLAHELRGDLDVITLKALAKEPGERYESAAAMAEDIARYLQHRPIRARPAPLSYRARKFMRRNRPMIGVSALAGVVVLAIGSYELEHRWAVRALPFHPPPQSIAVLPLTNEGGGASQQYFSDGISEDLITALSQFPQLKVIGRSSAFKFRDSKEDSRSIGVKLGAAHLLEGTVRKSGEMIRVSAALIDTVDGSTQWSEHYDRSYHDLFALQDEISRSVAGALKSKLVPAEHAAEQSDRPPNGSLEAYNAMLQGRFYFPRHTEGDFRKTIEYYTQAIELDPRYALAWSGLSRAWTSLGEEFLQGAALQEAYAKGRAAADRALALAPDLAAAHIARGYLLRSADYDWAGVKAEFSRALELAPNDAEVKFFVGFQLATFGEVERAIELSRQALETEPLRAGWYAWLGNYLLGVNRLDEAEGAVHRALELQPAAPAFHEQLTIIEIQRGHAQAALAAAQRVPPGAWQDGALALARQIGSDRSAADAALKTLIERDAGISAYQIAQVYALRNDAKTAFEWLDRARITRDAAVGGLLFDPFILRYKDDPRFAEFCRKVGLPVPEKVSPA